MPNLSYLETFLRSEYDELVTKVSVSESFLVNETISFDDDRLIKTTALWDTGSTHTSISTKLIKKLGLTSKLKCRVKFGISEGEFFDYKVNLYLPNGIVIDNIEVCAIPYNEDEPQIIIGMDIITLGKFVIVSDGEKFHLDFHMTSK